MSKALTIGQVATATGVSTHTLRYYEQAGLLRAIGRTAAGHRLYSPADLDWLAFVMRLRATGMPIAGMQAFAELRAQGDASYDARREMLAAHRDAVLARIADLQTSLAAITDKIDWYEAASREAATRAARHDEPARPQTQSSQPSVREQDSSWDTSHATNATQVRTAIRRAGKS